MPNKIKIMCAIWLLTSISLLSSPSVVHDQWNALLKKHVTAEGKVNYKGFIKDSVSLDNYLKLLCNNPPQDSWTKNEQMAFWINAYNAFTIKLVTKYYPVKSIKDIGSSIQIPFVSTPWDIKFIKIGGEKLDLNNIEHGKLRKKFGDARLHFALVCASVSCPILLNEAYTGGRLDEQLDRQARVFLSDRSKNDLKPESPRISKIFDWYAMDFKKDAKSVVDYINRFSTIKINKNAKLSYMSYDWGLNE